MASDKKESLKAEDLLWGAGCILLLLVAIWIAAGESIFWGMVHVRNETLRFMGLLWPHAEHVRQGLVHEVNANAGGQISFTMFKEIASDTGSVVRWLWVTLALGISGVLIMWPSKLERYRRSMTIEEMMEQEAKLWPEITPVVGLKLNNGDIQKGPWRVELTELEFNQLHGLTVDGVVDLVKAREVFSAQLGPRWRGWKALPPYARAIYASFALAIHGKEKEALARLRSMAQQHGSGPSGSYKNIDFSWADQVLHDLEKSGGAEGNEIIRRIGLQHAYVRTVMATMQQAARRGGVFPTNWYIWLRPVDRELYGILNAVGGYVAFAEYAGIMAHWLFEKSTGCPSVTPQVEEAVVDLQEVLKNYKTSDDPVRSIII